MNKKLKQLRRQHGWSQQDVAQKLGISLRNYRNKENGNLPFNQVEMIKIMQFANLSYEDIIYIFFEYENNEMLYAFFGLKQKSGIK